MPFYTRVHSVVLFLEKSNGEGSSNFFMPRFVFMVGSIGISQNLDQNSINCHGGNGRGIK